ncbi:hypothetical protein [Caulobacter sp.]|uniref:hypothetical protein n=1 Tax=Caulobacter sp. TaxID=78 RepID=UPI003BAF48F6
MSERLFLYIDILGFSELVTDDDAMADIFSRIDKLNVHTDRDFKTIVFSDTILVYGDGLWLAHKSQAVMWLCEFAQDLFHHFIKIDRHFRAYLTIGNFVHETKKHFQAFYGQALVECHNKEKEIKSTGLYMDNKLIEYSDIFRVNQYDDDCSFVHIMRALDEVSFDYKEYPIHSILVESTGIDEFVAPFFVYLRNIWNHQHDGSLHETVRLKYENTWKMISSRHAGLLKVLVENDFDPVAVSKMDWSVAMGHAEDPKW